MEDAMEVKTDEKCEGCQFLGENGKCYACTQCMGDILNLYDSFKEEFLDNAREHMEETKSEKELEMVYDAIEDSLDAMRVIIKGDLYYDAQHALHVIEMEIENKRGYAHHAPFLGAPDAID